MWRDCTRYEGSQNRNSSMVYAQQPCVRKSPHIVRRPIKRSNAPLGGILVGTSVCVAMYSRSCTDNQEQADGTRKNVSHRTTQKKPSDPVIMNDIRQPCLSSNHATKGAENAGPAKVPALKKAVARPRSLAGNHWRTTLPEVGNEAASPAPNASRVANMLPKVAATPVSIPAIDQIVTDKPLTQRVPIRSEMKPQTNRNRQ